MKRIVFWALCSPALVLMAVGALAFWSDYQNAKDRQRSEAERCFHYADYGEPPCDRK